MLRGVLLATASALLLTATPAWATDFQVTTPADHDDGACDSDCTLREAVNASNAGGTGNTITLPANDYVVTGATLAITNSVTISGPPSAQPTATIESSSGSRLFSSSGTQVALRHLTIADVFQSDGPTGGAALLLTGGTTTVDHDILTGNGGNFQGGAIVQQSGVLNITDSEIRGSHGSQAGGGLYMTAGTANVDRTLWIGNVAAQGLGGAIANEGGFLNVQDSTFVTNQSYHGGAIHAASSTSVWNSTFEGNQAIGNNQGGSALYMDTLSSATVQIYNVLFGNTGAGNNCAGQHTPTDNGGGSVDVGSSCGLASGERTIRLAPLASNGGAPTRSLLPYSDSQNLGTGDDVYCLTAPGTDQAGVTRTRPCNAGALEGHGGPAPAPVVDGEQSTVTGPYSAFVDATVATNGLPATYEIEYGTTPGSYPQHTGAFNVVYDPTGAPVSVESSLDDLQPATTYYYRVVSDSGALSGAGKEQTLTTPAAPPPPGAETGDATVTGPGQATLRGTVVPNGNDGLYSYFQYGVGNFASETEHQPISDGGITAEVFDLDENKDYQYRLVVADSAGHVLATGATKTFHSPFYETEYDVTGTGDPAGAACTGTGPAYSCASLRAAVAAAQAGNSDATVALAAATYALQQGPLTIDAGYVTLIGDSARTTIVKAQSGSRAIEVGAGSQVTELRHLTVTGGSAAGDEDGGDIASAGSLYLDHVRVTGGTAGFGGGIALTGGNAQIGWSLIDGNTATGGGGLWAGTASVSVIDSTVAGNTGGGIAVPGDGYVSLTAATVARNTGDAVDATGGGEAFGSIVIGSCSNRLHDDGANVGSTTCGFDTNVNDTNAGLADALSNAGGETDVLTIPATSPAATLVGQCALDSDQRDMTRPGTGCSAGAYEANATGSSAPSTPTVSSGPAATTGDATATFTFASDNADSYQCKLEPAGSARPFTTCTSPVTYDDLAPGAYTFTVRSLSESGVASSGATRTFTVAPATPTPTPTFSATPAPTPTASPAPTPTATPTPTPTPVPGKTVVAAPVSGTVLVQKPGTHTFIAVSATESIPLGSTVDTRHGKVRITSRSGSAAEFYDGLFKLTQSNGVTILTLTEQLAPCGKSARAASAAKKKPKTRKLWGNGSGAFSTRGQYSAATVRGTTWLVQDSCSGTLTRVTKGVVSVRDNVKRKTILLRAPHSYTAKPKKKR